MLCVMWPTPLLALPPPATVVRVLAGNGGHEGRTIKEDTYQTVTIATSHRREIPISKHTRGCNDDNSTDQADGRRRRKTSREVSITTSEERHDYYPNNDDGRRTNETSVRSKILRTAPNLVDRGDRKNGGENTKHYLSPYYFIFRLRLTNAIARTGDYWQKGSGHKRPWLIEDSCQ